MRLGMSLIVRDEADVVAHNLAFHAHHGVDAFAVLDNGSVDGTFELLQSLRSSFDVALFRDADGLRKEERSMFLAGHLRDRLGATHLISNDADEFWVPRGDSLRALMAADAPVVEVSRYNFIVRRAEIGRPDYAFFDSTWLVANPPARQPPAPDPVTPLVVPLPLRAVPGKVCCALAGLRHVFKGNHAVTHDAGAARDTDAAVILHYPVRTFEQFTRKIRNHGENLRGVTGAESWHLRRWDAIGRSGRIREEYDGLLFDEPSVRALADAGTIREERVIADFFAAPGRQPAPAVACTACDSRRPPRDP